MPGMLRLTRRKAASTVPSRISTDFQPSAVSLRDSSAVLAAPLAASSTTSLPSDCFCESAEISPSRRTFLFKLYSCECGTGPCTTPPLRNCGARRLPCRALPVPFWRYGFLVVPETSLSPLVLCVPARRLASCQCTTRAMMSGRGLAPNSSSGNSALPALALSRVVISTCIDLALSSPVPLRPARRDTAHLPAAHASLRRAPAHSRPSRLERRP